METPLLDQGKTNGVRAVRAIPELRRAFLIDGDWIEIAPYSELNIFVALSEGLITESRRKTFEICRIVCSVCAT